MTSSLYHWRLAVQVEQARACLLAVALALGACAGVSAKSVSTPEYAVKAAFLFNFAQFVEWPPEAYADSQAPLRIGVLGDDPFGTFLDETVQSEAVNGHPIQVARYRHVAEVEGCHILFISRSEADHATSIIDSLADRNTLTVSDAEGFAGTHVMIRFCTEEKKVRLKINVEAAKASGLSVSSKLLRLAEIVVPGQE